MKRKKPLQIRVEENNELSLQTLLAAFKGKGVELSLTQIANSAIFLGIPEMEKRAK